MAGGPDKRTGWSRAGEGGLLTTVRHVIRTVWEVVPGGVIRAGKVSYDDEAHAGFWLGTGADGVARLSLGGPAHSLRWTGESLEIRGWFSTPTVSIDADGLAILQGDDVSNQLRFVDATGEATATLQATGDGGPWVQLVTSQPDPGETARIDLWVDGDLGASVALRLTTTKGGGPASARLQFLVGQVVVAWIDSAGVLHAGGLDAGGWSGTFRTDEIAAVTVANGLVTGVT